MATLSSKPIAPDGPLLDQTKQTEVRVGPANLNKRFSTSWKQKISPAARDRPVTSESTGVGQPGKDTVPVEAAEVAEVTKPSSPHKLRSLVAFMSRRKSRAPRPVSAPPNLDSLPDSVKTGTPQPKLETPAPVVVSPSSPAAVSPSSPAAAATSASPQADVNRACSCAVCMRSSAPGVCQERAQTISSAQTTVSAQTAAVLPSSPALHPTFAAFLQKAAMAEAASARPAGVNATATDPRRQPAQRCPSTTSSRVSSRLHPDCNNPACVSAARQIRAVGYLKKEFAKSKIPMNYDTTLKALDAPLSAAYQVLLECEYKSVMARVGKVAAMLKQMEGLPVNNQNVIAKYRTLLRLSGLEGSTAPASALAGIGIQQRQSTCASGFMQPGGYTAGYAPTGGGYTSMAGRVPAYHNPSSLAALYASLAARYATPPAAGGGLAAATGYPAPGPAYTGATTIGYYNPASGYTPAVQRPVPTTGTPSVAGHALAPGSTPVMANMPTAGPIPAVGPAPAVQYAPAPTGLTPAARPAPATGPAVSAAGSVPAARPMPAPVGPIFPVRPAPANQPAVAVAAGGPGGPTVGNVSPVGFAPAPGSTTSPAVSTLPASVPMGAAVHNPAVQPTPTVARPTGIPTTGPTPTAAPTPAPRMTPVVGNIPTAGPVPATGSVPAVRPPSGSVGPMTTAALAHMPANGSVPPTGSTPAAVPAPTARPAPTTQSVPARIGLTPVAGRDPGTAPMTTDTFPTGPAPAVDPMFAVRHAPATGSALPAAMPRSVAQGLGSVPAPGPQAGTLLGLTPAVGPISAPVQVASTLAVGPTSTVQLRPPTATPTMPSTSGSAPTSRQMPTTGSIPATGSVL